MTILTVHSLVELQAFQLSVDHFNSKKDWPSWLRENYDAERDHGVNSLRPDWQMIAVETKLEDGEIEYDSERVFTRFWLRAKDGLHIVNYDDWLVYDNEGNIMPYPPQTFGTLFAVTK